MPLSPSASLFLLYCFKDYCTQYKWHYKLHIKNDLYYFTIFLGLMDLKIFRKNEIKR